MSKYKYIVIGLNLVLLLVYFNWSILAKENTLKHGALVLLELAPVDPRSLMQGDYMNLNYRITDQEDKDVINKRGFCILKKDSLGVAQKVRFQANLMPKAKDEVAVKYFSKTIGNDIKLVKIGAESFFFQEGQGKSFENAKYGALKVDEGGNSVLVGLYDENRIEIVAKN